MTILKNKNSVYKFLSNIRKKFLAFTLAETLIVMGIIGVVAALTIPNLNSSTNNMEKVAKVKKTYAELNEAHNRATAVYGPVETWFVNLPSGISESKRYIDRLTEFMKVTKTCTPSENGCFFSGSYRVIEMPTGNMRKCYGYKAILNNGINICVEIFDKTFNYSNSAGVISKVGGSIDIDIDGQNGKNTQGVDFFEFYIKNDGIYTDKSTAIGHCKLAGWGCTNWVIEKGNMEYLNAEYKPGIAYALYCKNGKELTWYTPSCK